MIVKCDRKGAFYIFIISVLTNHLYFRIMDFEQWQSKFEVNPIRLSLYTWFRHMVYENHENYICPQRRYLAKEYLKNYYLIRKKCDINADVCSIRGTPLNVACHAALHDQIEDILERPKLKINKSNDLGQTPAHFSVLGGSPHTVVLMRGAKKKLFWNIQDNAGMTALFYAMLRPLPNVVEELMKIPSLDWNIKDKNGNTPLFSLLYKQRDYEGDKKEEDMEMRLKILELVKDHPTIDWNIQCTDNRTIFHLAIVAGNFKAAEIIMKIPSLDWNIADDEGFTLWYTALFINNDKQLEDKMNIIKYVVKLPGIDWNKTIEVKKLDINVPILAVGQSKEVLECLAEVPSLDWNLSPCDENNALVFALVKRDFEFLKFFFTLPNIEYDVNNKHYHKIHKTTFAKCLKLIKSEHQKTGYNYSDVKQFLDYFLQL